jgi:hypothetical protein
LPTATLANIAAPSTASVTKGGTGLGKERVGTSSLPPRDGILIFAMGNGRIAESQDNNGANFVSYAAWPHRVMEMREDENGLMLRVRSVFQPDVLVFTEGVDPWLPYATFIENFSRLVVVQNPASFKFNKAVMHLTDATRPSETYSNDSFILQFPQSPGVSMEEGGSGAVIVVSTLGTTRKQLAQKLTIHAEPYDWKERGTTRPLVTSTTTSVTTISIPRPKGE